MSSDKPQKEAFGRKLEALAADKGWNQSELARRASLHLNGTMTRDSVSKYMRGYNWPSPSHRTALAKALGVQVMELMASAEENPLRIEQRSDGRVMLHLSKLVTVAQALQIMKIIEGAA